MSTNFNGVRKEVLLANAMLLQLFYETEGLAALGLR